MLVLERVSAGYGPALVLRGVSLQVEGGAIAALIGANGAGKSTLARTVSGLLPIREGTIRLDGERIDRLEPAARLARGIAHVPEGRQVFAGLSVRENLRLGAYGVRARLGAAGIARREAEMLALFPALAARLAEPAGNLSGGQQQVLAIGRALMSGPRVLVLDEPSLGLAPLLVAQMFALIAGLRDRGLAILLSEQNARQSLAIADRGHVLERGAIVLEGPARALMERPEVAERYLGLGAASTADPAREAALAARMRAVLMQEETRR